MRIRSTKPEFWQSETMAEFDFLTRLVLKALESYVDDNGVGKDSLTLFVTAAFPHDVEKSPEIFAKVSRSLDLLAERNLIVRYRVSGERLVYVRQWRKWQYIDKPKQGRYPRPDGTKQYSETVDESIGAGQGVTDPSDSGVTPKPPETFPQTSRNLPEDLPQIQSGEQGNRGTGEQEPPNPPDAQPAPTRALAKQTGAEAARARIANLPTRSAGAYRIAEAFSASLPVPIESELLSGIGVQIDKCLKRGIPPPAIAAGLKAWTDSDSWSPTQIPNFVHKANNRGHSQTGRGKPTEKALGYDDALTELLQEVQTL